MQGKSSEEVDFVWQVYTCPVIVLDNPLSTRCLIQGSLIRDPVAAQDKSINRVCFNIAESYLGITFLVEDCAFLWGDSSPLSSPRLVEKHVLFAIEEQDDC